VFGHELLEFGAVRIEGQYAADGVEGRDEADEDGRAEDEDVGYPGVVRVGPASDFFEDIESVSLSDIICILNVLDSEVL